MSTQEELVTPALSKGQNGQSATPKDTSVLLVEDDRSLRRFMEIVLERAGYQVSSAQDGVEAMKIVLNGKVDIVITDAMMPHLNGYEFARFLRNSPQLSHIPIVILSALEPVGSQRTERVDAFLTKPVAPEELLECLERVLEQAG
jgi:CheY-like chemotaxis protein